MDNPYETPLETWDEMNFRLKLRSSIVPIYLFHRERGCTQDEAFKNARDEFLFIWQSFELARENPRG